MTDKAKNFLLYQFQNCIRNREIQGKEWKGVETKEMFRLGH